MSRDQHLLKCVFDAATQEVLVSDQSTGKVVARVPPVATDPATGDTLDIRDADTNMERWVELAVHPEVFPGLDAQTESAVRANPEGPRAPRAPRLTQQGRRRDHDPVKPPPFSSTDYAVEGYLLGLEALRSKSLSGPDRAGARRAWVALRDARIFAVPQPLCSTFIQAWEQLHEGEMTSRPDPDWPAQFPFASIWLGYNDSAGGDFDQSRNWMDAEEISQEEWERHVLNPMNDGHIFGHLVTDDRLWTFIRNPANEVNVYLSHDATGWLPEYVVFQELAPLLIEYVNQQRTFLIEKEAPGLRRRLKMGRKKYGVQGKRIIPPPYYKVRVRSTVIHKVAERVAEGVPASYRHDVRAHERCRIRRGPLPIGDKQREKLQAAGYQIFTVNPLDGETLARLAHRGVPMKSASEWLGIRVSWIEAHISPANEELPYVPATRVLAGTAENKA